MVKPIKKAVIPVAGLGTRMLSATKAIPKELRRFMTGLSLSMSSKKGWPRVSLKSSW